jgi:simple sugar transport system permease protein
MGIVSNIVYDTVYHSAPIILCVLGGIFAYKANVLNIALEGFMLMGAFISALFVMLWGDTLLAGITSVGVGLILGLVFSYFTASKNGNPIITGLAINMIALSFCAFMLKVLGTANINVSSVVSVADLKINIPFIQDIPIVGDLISGHPPLTYVAFIGIFVMWLLMYKTKLGIYIRVVGEKEEAAKSVGINTTRIKYIAILIGALCCVLAGINLSVDRVALFTNNMTAGRGFIAIAAIYCGRGKPGASAMYALVFGFAKSLSVNLKLFAGPIAGLFEVLPYVIMVIVLVVVSIVKNRNVNERGYES